MLPNHRYTVSVYETQLQLKATAFTDSSIIFIVGIIPFYVIVCYVGIAIIIIEFSLIGLKLRADTLHLKKSYCDVRTDTFEPIFI